MIVLLGVVRFYPILFPDHIIIHSSLLKGEGDELFTTLAVELQAN